MPASARIPTTLRRPVRGLRPVPTVLAAAALLALAPAHAVDHVWTAGNFVAGLTAPNPLPAGDTLYGRAGSNNKNFSGASFTNQGTVAWQTTERIGFVSSSVLNGALWDLQADANLTYAGGSASTFANDGSFRKSGGAGSSVIGNNIVFTNSGTIDAQTGTIDFAGGSATFNAGSQFTGAGVVRVSGNASFVGAFTSANLLLAGGTYAGSGTTPATVNGMVRWTGGSFAGTWQVAAGQTVVGGDGANKNFSGASFANHGSVTWQSAERIGFVSSSVTNTGTWDLQADAALSYAGGGASTFTNAGSFRKSGGAGSTVVGNNVVFVNSGVVDAASGTIDFAGGSASFLGGTQFTGAGVNRVSASANFVGGFVSQNLELAAGTFSGDSTTPAQLGGQVRWTGGSFSGSWQVDSGQTLTALDGGDKNFSGASFTNHGTVVWGSGERAGFVGSAVINLGLWDLQADANLTYVGGGASTFANAGTFRKSAGPGSAVIGNNIVFSNSGVIDAQSGTIDFAGGSATFNAGTQFTGAGVVRVSGSASFVGGFTSANLLLAGGSFAGDNTTPAVLGGQVRWTGGSFAGTWQIAGGQVLTTGDGAAKTFIGASLTNAGTVAWESAEQAGFISSSVTNAALWDLRSDAGLTYTGGSSSTFTNQGTFRKSVGSGSSVIGGNIQFVNFGSIDAQSGTIDFAGGAASFRAGTQFTGAGTVRISNNAGFVGAFTSANLRLDAGTYAGDNTTPAQLGGQVVWTGGSFAGTWQVGAGQGLTALDGAGAKQFASANFTNAGTLQWDSVQNAGFVSSSFVNEGLFDLRSDADIAYAGGGASSFVNAGVLRKSAGSGASVVTGNIAFSNPGTIEALAGTLQFTGNLTNPGTVRGTATVQTALLTNDGFVAPGAAAAAAPATLTLAGSFAQGVAGTLGIDVESLASHDLLIVTGSVNLGGTLAVACYGACFFDVGDEIVVLDYAGSRSGSSFAGLTLTGFATGGFEAVYDDANTRVLLRVTEAVTPVPEPGPAALLLAGLAVLGGLARRRRG